ncbi:MAG: LexA repressor [Candidatus Celerinatantimonas neptuna]|nr:MAG: LexA repressor [Candidatus Celerinatantimonas neptuna]
MTSIGWYTADELAGLPGLPKAASSISRKATKEGWEKRQKKGVKGVTYEYASTNLPAETLTELKYRKRHLITPQNRVFQSLHTEHTPHECKSPIDFAKEFALIPYYPITSWHPRSNESFPHTGTQPYLAFRRNWLTHRGFNEKELTIIKAIGDSMEPTINNNDTVVINQRTFRLHDGQIYAFVSNEELLLKRYQYHPNQWRLLSDNIHYPPLDIPYHEQHQFEIIGQVVHIAKDI